MPEKTEDPTPRKLEKSRQEGNVPHSKEFSECVIFLALIAYFVFAGDEFLQRVMGIFDTAASCDLHDDFACLRYVSTRFFYQAFTLILPLVTLVMIASIFSEIGQVGIVFAPKKLEWSFSKFNVINNAKNIFSVKTLIALCKMLFIASGASLIIWKVISTSFRPIYGSIGGGIMTIFHTAILLLKREYFFLLFFFFFIATMDLLYQRWTHKQQLMMTRPEVDQERKDDQGSPEMKQRRKERHKEILSQGTTPEEKTESATAVVTNPTHCAVAIYYNKFIIPLPIVIAKGEGETATRMISVANKNAIPVVRNVPLARGLMRFAELGRFIPLDFIEPIAEVLKTVREMRHEKLLAESGEVDLDEEW